MQPPMLKSYSKTISLSRSACIWMLLIIKTYLDKATQPDSIFPLRAADILVKNDRVGWNINVNKWTICSSDCDLISNKMYDLRVFAEITA